MPGVRHEAVVELLQTKPLLVLLLLAHAGVSVQFVSRISATIADSNLSERDPRRLKVCLADNVFVFEGDGRKIAVVAEVQASRPGRSRSLAWPAYVANARARHGCDTLLMVFATAPEAARGSARTVRTGHPGYDLTPLLTGIGKMPEPGGPHFAPELLLLNIITGDLALNTHEAPDAGGDHHPVRSPCAVRALHSVHTGACLSVSTRTPGGPDEDRAQERLRRRPSRSRPG